ncbi:MAG: PRC-barrel domain-containing protein [Candidatus Berkelbacteria bacterium]|nr:PRC-barrel domain-containing protein [Candidatus Berkelbacteria bacterium]
MVVDAAPLLGRPVISTTEKKLGVVDRIVFDGIDAKIAGFQVNLAGVLKRFAALEMMEVISIERDQVVTDDGQTLSRDLKHFDELIKHWGTILNVYAKTESGRKIGRVVDVAVDDQTGYITRFYLRDFLRERIIPRRFLVSITPKTIIFKDVVAQPIFDSEAVAAEAVGVS